MPIQNRIQGSTVFKIIAQETDKYMGYSPRENLDKLDLIQDELGSEISITTRSFRICSINKLMIIVERENHTQNIQTSRKGKLA